MNPTDDQVIEWALKAGLTGLNVRILVALKQFAGMASDAGMDHAAKDAGIEIDRVGKAFSKEVSEWRKLSMQQQKRIAELEAALLDTARRVEALKRPCGMDPETPQALRNSKYMSIALNARAAAEIGKACSVAAEFETRSVGEEQLLCNRYYSRTLKRP
jgi:hypothetical protein